MTEVLQPEILISEISNLLSKTKKVFFRLGYGFTRQRNGSFNMHAVICIPTLLGAWKELGGGAFYNNGGIYNINKNLIEGLNFKNENLSIKIDVEGHELYTLRGLVNNLKNNNCMILLEISNGNFDKVNNFFKSINYDYIFKSKFRPFR
mgnify:CR=1 FL=1